MDYIKSPLNYTGGKYKLLSQIMPLIPHSNRLFDIFCGGLNVGVNAKADMVVANDTYIQLIEIYRKMQLIGAEQFIGAIHETIRVYNKIAKGDSERAYYKLREEYNKTRGAIELFTLITQSFNNQIRFNSKQEFNMPYGQRTFNGKMQKNTEQFIPRIKNISFLSMDAMQFMLELQNISSNDTFFIDPPYLITNAAYNYSSWNQSDDDRLHAAIDYIHKAGAKFVYTNALQHKGKKNIQLYRWGLARGYDVIKLSSDYSNCSYIKDSGESMEILIKNF